MHGFRVHLDRGILGDAKKRLTVVPKVTWRSSGEGGHGCILVHQQPRTGKESQEPGAGNPPTVRGHQFSGATLVPGQARRDGPIKKSTKRKMIGVIKKKLQAERHVEFQTLVKQFTIIVASGLAAHDLKPF